MHGHEMVGLMGGVRRTSETYKMPAGDVGKGGGGCKGQVFIWTVEWKSPPPDWQRVHEARDRPFPRLDNLETSDMGPPNDQDSPRNLEHIPTPHCGTYVHTHGHM